MLYPCAKGRACTRPRRENAVKKALLAGAAGAALLAGAATLIAQHSAQARLDAAIAEARASMGPGGELTVASAKADFLSSSARVTGLVARLGGGTTTADELVLTDVSEERIGTLMASNVRHTGGASPFSFASVRLENASMAGLAEARRAGRAPDPAGLSFDVLRFEGLSVQAAKGETSIAALAVTAFGPGRRTSVALTGVEVPATGKSEFDRVSAKRVSLSGLDLARMVAEARAGKPLSLPGGDVAGAIEEVIGSKDGQRVVEVAGASLSLSQPPSGPSRAEFAMRGIVGKTTPEAARRLADLGYGEVVVDLEARAEHEPATGRLDVGPIVARGRNMGELSLRVELEGVPPAGPAVRPEALVAARLVSATVRYVDASLVDRAVRLAAREGGATEDEVRTQLATLARAQTGPRPPSAAEASLREALAAFVAKPGTLEATARPDRPMPIASLAQAALLAPDRLVDRLRVTATAK